MSEPVPDTAWVCPGWAEHYADLVATLQRGEDPVLRPEPLVFRRAATADAAEAEA